MPCHCHHRLTLTIRILIINMKINEPAHVRFASHRESPSTSRESKEAEERTVMTNLDGRRALVTGGGTGIGFGCAERLLAAGAHVTIAGRREDVLQDALKRLDAPADKAVAVVCDVTDETQGEKAVEVAAGGHNLDVLVANAGSGFPAPSCSWGQTRGITFCAST